MMATHQSRITELVIHNSVDGILAFDRELCYTLWNPAMEQISGLRAADVLGRCALELFPFLAEIGEDRYFYDALAGRSVVARERPFTVPSTGRSGYFEGHYAPIREASGEVIGGLAVIRDITRRQETQEELRQTNVALKSAQAQLVQAGKLAAMGQLGAGIAHELNQPLTAIQLLVESIRARPDAPVHSWAQDLDVILEQCQRMGGIVNNLRTFARRSDLSLEPLDAEAPLRDALLLMSEQLRLAGVCVTREISASLPRVLGDPVRLQQVFLNLLHNALDAVKEQASDGRRIHLQIGRVDGRVEYRVEDSGPGVPPEVRKRMFDPFYTTKQTGQGTGLGLSLSYGIVREHQGEIAYEALPGGSRFVVRLDPTDEVPAPEEVPVPPEPPVLPSKQRILVVDDEVTLQQTLQQILSHWGFDATAAASGEEALALMEAGGCFDLALVDLKMPDMTGTQLCEIVRKRWPACRLVAMSGYATNAERSYLGDSLGVEVLAKPMTQSELLSHIRRVLA